MSQSELAFLGSITALLGGPSLVLMAAAERYNRRQAAVLAMLRSHDAKSRDAALSLETPGIALDAAYRALMRGGVVVEVAGGRAYLSPAGLAAATRQQARRRGAVLVALVALPVLMMLAASLLFVR